MSANEGVLVGLRHSITSLGHHDHASNTPAGTTQGMAGTSNMTTDTDEERLVPAEPSASKESAALVIAEGSPSPSTTTLADEGKAR
jgi:hypothetical protein